MAHDFLLAPSILSADFANLASEVAQIESVVEWLHVDVMDGHYVPNLTIGPPVVKSLRASTDCFLDTHLMIDDPRTYAPQFVAAGSDQVTFHPEVDEAPLEIIRAIQADGARAGVAIKPSQPLSMITELLPHVDLVLIMTVEPGFGGQSFMHEVMPKLAAADQWRRDNDATFRLEVDGGISKNTIAETVRNGADTFVAGSAVFGPEDRVAAASSIMQAAADARAVVGAEA